MHSVGFLCKEMPPRKRKSSHQALEKQVAAKRQGQVQPADVPASTTPELETTFSDPANSMAVTTQQDQGTVVPPPPCPLACSLPYLLRPQTVSLIMTLCHFASLMTLIFL